MVLSDLAPVAIVLAYALGTVLFLAGIFTRRPVYKRVAGWCALLGFCLHTVVMATVFVEYGFAQLPRSYFIQFLSWSLLMVFFILWWRLRLEFLALTASPLALIIYLGSFKLPVHESIMPKALTGAFFGLHIASLFLSIAFMAMAFGSGVMFLIINRKIKSKEPLSEFQKDLPSLNVFDRVNHLAALVGFPCFTLGILSGFVWAKLTWGRLISWDPKEIVSMVIWFLFALLFHQRMALGWRGRKPAALAIWIFAITAFSMLIINLFLPTHHSFKA